MVAEGDELKTRGVIVASHGNKAFSAAYQGGNLGIPVGVLKVAHVPTFHVVYLNHRMGVLSISFSSALTCALAYYFYFVHIECRRFNSFGTIYNEAFR